MGKILSWGFCGRGGGKFVFFWGKLLPNQIQRTGDPTEPGTRRRHTSEMVLVTGLVRLGLVLSSLWTRSQGSGLHWCLNSLLTGLSALGGVVLIL